jgi:hypothetical protein
MGDMSYVLDPGAESEEDPQSFRLFHWSESRKPMSNWLMPLKKFA